MAVYVNNITIDTGEYFSRDFFLDNADGSPLDLTGYTAASQIRKHPESLNAAAVFNIEFVDRVNGNIKINGEKAIYQNSWLAASNLLS